MSSQNRDTAQVLMDRAGLRPVLAFKCKAAIELLVRALSLHEHYDNAHEVEGALWRRLAEAQIDWTDREVEEHMQSFFPNHMAPNKGEIK